MTIHARSRCLTVLRPVGVRLRLPGRVALVAGLVWSVQLPATPLQSPEFCMPGSVQTPEQLAKIAAALLKEPEGTRRMAALLQQIIRDADPMRNPFRSTDQVAYLRATIAHTTDLGRLLDLKIQLVQQVLQTGLADKALKENEEILRDLSHYVPQDTKNLPQLQAHLMTMSALCYLRMGEQENCLLNHNADSCLFPDTGRRSAYPAAWLAWGDCRCSQSCSGNFPAISARAGC